MSEIVGKFLSQSPGFRRGIVILKTKRFAFIPSPTLIVYGGTENGRGKERRNEENEKKRNYKLNFDNTIRGLISNKWIP